MHLSFTGIYTATESCDDQMLSAKSDKIKKYLLALEDTNPEVLESFVDLRLRERLIEVDLTVEAVSLEDAASRADALIKEAILRAIGRAPDGQMYLHRKSTECEILSR